MHDNDTHQVAGVCRPFLDDEGIDGLVRFPDLNSIANRWDVMYRIIHICQLAPQTVQEIAEALFQVLHYELL